MDTGLTPSCPTSIEIITMIICSIISIDWAGKRKSWCKLLCSMHNAQHPFSQVRVNAWNIHIKWRHTLSYIYIYNSVISSGCNNVERGGAPLLAGGGGGVLGRGSQGGHQRHGHARSGLMVLCIMTHYKDNHFNLYWTSTGTHTGCFITYKTLDAHMSIFSGIQIKFCCLMTINLEKNTQKKNLKERKG